MFISSFDGNFSPKFFCHKPRAVNIFELLKKRVVDFRMIALMMLL